MSTEQDKDEKIRQLEEQLFNQGQQLEQRDAQIEQRDAQIEQQRQRIANLVLFIIDNHLSTENVGTNISSTAANSGSSINIVNTWSMNPQQFSDYGQVQMTSQALTTQPISSQNVQSGASLVNTFGGSSARQQKNRMTKDYEAILNEV
uniref:Uncharacterized protein n=1 Tax=Meloidogyne javanica TaxID=6303 RepID=A0A915LR51_MELJA